MLRLEMNFENFSITQCGGICPRVKKTMERFHKSEKRIQGRNKQVNKQLTFGGISELHVYLIHCLHTLRDFDTSLQVNIQKRTELRIANSADHTLDKVHLFAGNAIVEIIESVSIFEEGSIHSSLQDSSIDGGKAFRKLAIRFGIVFIQIQRTEVRFLDNIELHEKVFELSIYEQFDLVRGLLDIDCPFGINQRHCTS